MIVILIGGKKNTGKSYLTDEIIRQKPALFSKASFANYGKGFLIKAKLITEAQAYGSKEQKEELTKVRVDGIHESLLKGIDTQGREYLKVREVMQIFMNNMMKQFGSSIWAGMGVSDVEELEEIDIPFVVFDDFRFYGVENIMPFETITVYLEKGTSEEGDNDKHDSETSFSSKQADLVLTSVKDNPHNVLENVTKIMEFIDSYDGHHNVS